ncbi:heavy metal translocatin [Phlebopus sp. FC_14]|nr:heavy metal translocatin [Phlebopus sp. FC_14]
MATTILLSNLHCASCVCTIQEALFSLTPPPTMVDVSVVNQSVTVEHPPGLSVDVLQATLDEAGFDISPASDDAVELSRLHRISGVSSFLSRKRKKHVQQCSLCQEEASSSHQPRVSKSSPVYSDLHPTATLDSPNDNSTADKGTESLNITAEPPQADRPHRLTLSVGGMTCASCAGTITERVSQLPGISDVVVTLLSNSATVVVEKKDMIPSVLAAIDDCGFEVEIINAEPLSAPASEATAAGPRSVSLKVDGMFCQHCPGKIMSALRKLGPQVLVTKPLTNQRDLILEVTYEPAPPDFTVRTIIAAIISADPSLFTCSLYRPPTIEQRTHSMHLREQKSLLSRLLFTFLVAIPTFVIAVVYMSLVSSDNQTRHYLMEPMWNGNASRIQWSLFFLATPVMFYGAGIFHRRSIREISALWRKGSRTPIVKRFTRFGSMNLLVSTGVSVAYFASVALLGLSASHSPAGNGEGDNTTYFDSVVFLTLFLLLGRFLEAYSKSRTADALAALRSLRPAEALLICPRSMSNGIIPARSPDIDLERSIAFSDNGNFAAGPGYKVEKVLVDLLEVGDMVRVLNGATPPSDGTVVSCTETAFDESSLTGEARLIKKKVGDRVFLGTINKSKAVDVRVDAIGGLSMLDHIVKIVREGQTRRAPIERVADTVTAFFVPIVTLLAIITWVTWLALGFGGGIPGDYLDIDVGGWAVWSLEFAIAVFVVACPCGIGLAAPTALMVGSGLAAKYGILARGGGEAFQEMAQVDLVAFDKTGTLTRGGQPQVSNFEVVSSVPIWKQETILGIAAELESASSHPLGVAIKHYSDMHCADQLNASAFDETPGRGLKARFNTLERNAIIGNEAWMAEHGINIDTKVSDILGRWKTEAKSVVLLALSDAKSEDFNVIAIFAVMDPLRPEATSAIRHLQDSGVATWMISGDNEVTAKAVAKVVGIPTMNVIAGVLPHQKAEKIEWLRKNGPKRPPSTWQRLSCNRRSNDRCIVAMVGDGINDAPALAASDVGIAIGSGSDVALSSASFILISSDLQSLLTLCGLSRTVFNRVKLNFVWASVYNVIALPIAAGVIYPAGHTRLAPVWASLAMALSSVSVVTSSLMLRFYREPMFRSGSNS